MELTKNEIDGIYNTFDLDMNNLIFEITDSMKNRTYDSLIESVENSFYKRFAFYKKIEQDEIKEVFRIAFDGIVDRIIDELYNILDIEND